MSDKSINWPVTGFRVVVRQNPVTDKTASGIITEAGDSLRRKQAGQIFGKIIGIGDAAFKGSAFGANDREVYLKCMAEGTTVQYKRYAGQGFSMKPDDPNAVIECAMADVDIIMPMPSDEYKSF